MKITISTETDRKATEATNSSVDRPRLVERTALRMLRPIVRWLIQQGITYPQFSESLKHLFLDAARKELRARALGKMSATLELKEPTDSALSLLSGVHRRDIRNFRAAEQAFESARLEPSALSLEVQYLPASDTNAPQLSKNRFGLSAQVVARWFSDPNYLDVNEQPLLLTRSGDVSFDALVASISTDVRPRAVLDQLLHLSLVEISEEHVRLVGAGFAPRADWAALSASATDNITDHLRAAIDNLDGKENWLEQAIFSDEMSAESVQKLHVAASAAWRGNHRKLMQLAQQLYEQDLANREVSERVYRARIGMFYYDEKYIVNDQAKE
jgi:Family of unknown function (DUF6502)